MPGGHGLDAWPWLDKAMWASAAHQPRCLYNLNDCSTRKLEGKGPSSRQGGLVHLSITTNCCCVAHTFELRAICGLSRLSPLVCGH